MLNNIKSIAIGRFDGFHLGHKELFKHLDEFGAILIIYKGKYELIPNRLHNKFINIRCFYLNYEEIKNLSPKEFVQFLKHRFINLEKIVIGYDFKFGKNRSGDAKILKELFDKEVIIVDEIIKDQISVHSSIIKELIKNGDIKVANDLLGENYKILGNQDIGQGIGSKELVSTINLTTDFLIPKFGVYATRIKIDKNWYKSVTFVGVRFCTNNEFSIETNIIEDFKDYDFCTTLWIEFYDFIRECKKFKNLSDLKLQIQKDINFAKEIL